MSRQPFDRLGTSRMVTIPGFPPDLARFYSEYEPIDLDVSEHYSIELNPLNEVEQITWDGLELLWDRPDGWEKFAAFLIGYGCFGERIVSVIDAASCRQGSILALGGQINWGPGGTGPFALCGSLVLASSFSNWCRHLEEEGWWEYAVGFGIPELTVDHQRKLRRYYLTLNPDIEWPEP
jgi:hypothetical protein